MDQQLGAPAPGVPAPGPAVAVFDVDGTLTLRDTLLPFLAGLCGRAAVSRALARHGVRLGAALLGAGSRDDVKEAVLGDLVTGRDAGQVRAAGDRFAERVLRTGMRADTVARLRWHRAQGHQVVLLSASLADYLVPLGRLLGADAVLCSRLEAGADGRLTGRLEGGNCRGPEKVVRLRAWLAGRTPVLWAYGDSSGDRELLAAADTPTLLRRRVRLAEAPAGSAR